MSQLTMPAAKSKVPEFTAYAPGSLIIVKLPYVESDPMFDLNLRNMASAATAAGVVAIFVDKNDKIETRDTTDTELAKIGLMRFPKKTA